MTKGVVVRPILSRDFSSRGQVDLIDMQSHAHMNYKWIMVYEDHLTKFCVLRSLTSKRPAEIAYQEMDVFLLFGAPTILQSDNGSEFTVNVITELKQLWPDMKLVDGVVVNKINNDQYKIAVKGGLLNGHYSRNQFDLFLQRLLVTDDVCVDNSVSLREAVSSESASGGQGFIKCNCSGTKRCNTNRCKYFKAKLKCNSRCHHSLNCCNK